MKLREESRLVGHLTDQGRKVGGSDVQIDSPALQQGEVEQQPQHLRHPIGLRDDRRQSVAQPLRVGGSQHDPPFQKLRLASDDGQRRLQIV